MVKIGDYDFRLPVVKREVASIQVAITDEGRREAESYTGSGAKFAVISTLNEHSPLTIQAICRETGIDVVKVRAVLNELKEKNHVRRLKDREEVQETHEVQG